MTILTFPGEGSLIVVKPGGGQLNLSLGTKWPCHCKETGTRPRHRLVDRSNVASCAMMDDQISVSGKHLSAICVNVVTADFTVISGFRNLFFDVFCVPGVGTLNLI